MIANVPIKVHTTGEHQTDINVAQTEALNYIQYAAPSFKINQIQAHDDMSFTFIGESDIRDIFVLKQYRDVDCHVIGQNESED